MGSEPSTKAVDPQPWTPQTRDYVQNQQEDAYRDLAASLGLGNDPKAAFARLNRPRMPLSYASPEIYIADLLSQGIPLSEEDIQRIKIDLPKFYNRYFSLDPPTQYENANRYSSLAVTFDGLLQALNSQGKTINPRPLLATLPTGDVNAKIMVEPKTGVPIMFFEQALFRFFNDFAIVASWAFSPMSLVELYDDAAIRRMQSQHTMPLGTSGYLADALYSYVVQGSTKENQSRSQPAPHNRALYAELLQEMQRFVMAHEIGHFMLGHLDDESQSADRTPEASWKCEYEADEFGLDLMLALAKSKGASSAFHFWACDLVLTLYVILFRAISLLQFGTQKVTWVSPTHPDPTVRRTRLRERMLQSGYSLKEKLASRLGFGTAAGQLCGMSDDILGRRLLSMVFPTFIGEHRRGVRPSPLWNKAIANNFKLDISQSSS
jgi:IrrE N-terminal-like domain